MIEFKKALRLVWIATLIVVIFVLAYLKLVPSGKITYIKKQGQYNDFISNLTPADRMSGNKMIGDPAYFSLRVPRRFEKARVTFKFKNNSTKSIINAGVLMDKKVWNYDLKPLSNSVIDKLLSEWDAVRSGELLFLQREKKFGSVEEFLKNLPNQEKIASYNYSPKVKFSLPDYKPAKQKTTLCRPIQGAYQFYTYIKDEDLSFDFSFEDLNKNEDADGVDVLVYYNNQEIYKDALPDDGGSKRNLKLSLSSLPEGVYKIGLRANNDIVTRTITTAQSKIAFINKVALADAPELSCGRNLFTNSKKIQAMTILSDRLGQIKIHQMSGSAFSQIIELSETYKQFSSKDILPAFSEVVMPSDGITISGDGLFALSADHFFNPEIKKVDENFDADREGVDFIIAKYAPPIADGEWSIATADFDLANAYKENNKHSFLISVPGLRAEDSAGAGVEIGDVKIELEGVSLLKKVIKMINDR
jgi:hypothetical protein